MARILHILPHPGGGGETIVDLLFQLAGHEHERVYLSSTRRPLVALPGIARSRARLRRRAHGADVLNLVGDASAAIMLPHIGRRPTVFGTHGLHLLRRAGGLAGAVVRQRLRAVVSRASLTVCCSRSELEELSVLVGPESRRLRLVRNGIPVPVPATPEERLAIRSELGLRDADVVGLYLGQLEDRKLPLIAVEAAEQTAAGGLPFVLLVAGDGPLAGRVRARAGPAVRPLGYRNDPERLLAAADVFVMPSEREGLSLAVLEAMGNSLAPVVADGPGNPEAVGDAGVVVPVGDAGALAQALTGLASNEGERLRLGRAARSRLEQEFSAERFLDEMGQAFEEALERR